MYIYIRHRASGTSGVFLMLEMFSGLHSPVSSLQSQSPVSFSLIKGTTGVALNSPAYTC